MQTLMQSNDADGVVRSRPDALQKWLRPSLAVLWCLVGGAKIITPASFIAAGIRLDEGFNFALGLLEVLLGLAVLVRRWWSYVIPVSMAVAMAFTATALGSTLDADCGCLGSLKIERSARVMLSGVLVILSSILWNRRTR